MAERSDARRPTIVSGGQTGVDRAALDFALEFGFPHGGWCPRGRRAEDGTIPPRYRLRETESSDYAVRTRRNVEDSDATWIFAPSAALSGGTRMTAELARTLAKPLLVHTPACDADELVRWLAAHPVGRLNVAGPRASGAPELAAFVRSRLMHAFGLGG